MFTVHKEGPLCTNNVWAFPLLVRPPFEGKGQTVETVETVETGSRINANGHRADVSRSLR